MLYQLFRSNKTAILTLFLIILTMTIQTSLWGQTDVSGTISSNTSWTVAGGPYTVTSAVTVDAGVTLTIEAGVTVQFNSQAPLYVKGTIQAVGTSGSPIIFTGSTQTAGFWRGVQMNTAGSGNFDYCTFSYGGYWDNCCLKKSGTGSFTLKNSTISNSSKSGLILDGHTGTSTFTGNTINNNAEYGVWVALDTTADLKDTTTTFSSNTLGDVGLAGGTTTKDVTWSLDKAYAMVFTLSTTVDTGTTLTVKSGTKIKFASQQPLYVKGAIEAVGTSADPIIFTGLAETAGYWRGVQMNTAGSGNFDYCTFSYGGYWDECCLKKSGTGAFTLNNSTISNSSKYGLILDGHTGTSTFSGNAFNNNTEYGIWVALDTTADLKGTSSSFSSNTTGDVGLAGGTTTKDVTWSLDKAYAMVFTLTTTVDTGTTLTVKSGTKVKFSSQQALYIKGAIEAVGTSADPIIFTGYAETTGYWRGVQVNTAGTGNFDYCTFSYGGYWDECCLKKSGTGTFTLKNSTTSYSSKYGFIIDGHTGTSTFSGNAFNNNSSYGIWVALDTTADLKGTSTTFSSNTTGDVGLAGGTTTKDVTWSLDKAYAMVLTLTTTVDASTTLTVKSGTKIKFGSQQALYVKGTIEAVGTSAEPIVFTGYAETTGYWRGLQLNTAGTGNFDYCTFSYGGYWDECCLLKTGTGALTLKNSIISNSSKNGLTIHSNTGTLTFEDNTYSTNTNGIYLGVNTSSNFIDTDTVFASNSIDVLMAGGQMTSDTTWQIPYGYSLYLSATVTVNSGATLTVEPGTTVKIASQAAIYVQGTISAVGNIGSTINFTDLRDDSIGGDANHDSTATTPAKGWWRGLQVTNAGVGTFEYCEFKYAGYWDLVNVLKSGTGAFSLKNSTISQSSGSGLHIKDNTGTLTIEKNTFSDNVDGVLFTNPPAGVVIKNCRIESNSDYGVENTGTTEVDARNNWWGDASGPTHASNADGKGDKVTDYVNFDPWNTTPTGGQILAPIRSGQIAAGDTLRFIGNPNATSGQYYSWNLGDSRKSDLSSPGLVTFSTTGTKTVTYSLVDSKGAEVGTTDSRSIEVVTASSPPDLKVTQFDPPATLAVGQTVTIDYQVKNSGVGAISSKSWDDSLYLSADQYLDAGDTILSRVKKTNQDLASGASYSSSFTLTVPAVSTGKSYLILSLDDQWQVLEQYQLNNESAGSTSINVNSLASGTKSEGSFSKPVPQYYRIDVSADKNLILSFTGKVTIYLSYGAFPTLSNFDYKMNYQTASQIIATGAAEGAWYVMVMPDSSDSKVDYSITPTISELALVDSEPAKIANTVDMVLTLKGAGFGAGLDATLVDSTSGTTVSASSVSVDTFTSVTATWSAASVPVGKYHVKVTKGALNSQINDSLEVVASGTSSLSTSVVLPERMGYHQLATIYVEYSNTGELPMAAPILLLTATQNDKKGALMTLDASILSKGFWTSVVPDGFSNEVFFLANGKKPGVLQPGESGKVPVYYAGWQKPWDFSYPPFDFTVKTLDSSSTLAIDLASFGKDFQPKHISDAAWAPVWDASKSKLGTTWGNFVTLINQNASYLGTLDQNVSDIGELLALTINHESGLNPIYPKIAERDSRTLGPNFPLTFDRYLQGDILGRYDLGPLGYGWTHEWDVNVEKDSDGNVTIRMFEIDRGGFITRVYQPDSRGGYLTDPWNQATLKASGDKLILTKKDGQVLTFNSSNQLESLADRDGNTITATYTSSNLTKLTHSNSHTLTLAYNASGRLTSITDDLGGATSYTYDTNNELLATVTEYDGRAFSFSYVGAGSDATVRALSEVTYPDARKNLFTYDSQGRLASISAAGEVEKTTITYGSGGKVTFTDDQSNSTIQYFNAKGVNLKTLDPLGNITLRSLGQAFKTDQVTQADGQESYMQYDGNGDLIKAVLPGRATCQFDPDNFGKISSMTDANGNKTTYTNDSKGGLTSATDAAGEEEKFTRDNSGRPTQWTNRRGQSVTYAYGSSGLLSSKTYPDSSQVAYTYDSFDRLSKSTTADGDTTFDYYANDLLKKITYPGGQSLTYVYDSANRRQSITDHQSNAVNYSYDSFGRLAELKDQADQSIVAYTYNTLGQLSRKTLGNTAYTDYTYNALGLITKVSNHKSDKSVISSYEYTYDAINRVETVDSVDGKWTYTYGSDSQLVSAKFASKDVAKVVDQEIYYSYDPMGNRTKIIANGTTSQSTVNNLNQITVHGTENCVYDADGNMTSRVVGATTWTYTYDYENRLTQITDGTDTWNFAYDGLGNRVSTTKNGTKTLHLVDPDGLGNLMGDYAAADGTLQARYVHGAGLESMVDSGGSKAFYTYDALGNTSELLDNSQVTQNAYAYRPFGSTIKNTEAITNRFQFVGQMGVEKSGGDLSFMRARFYSATLGRFLNQDPLNLNSGDPNLYRYAHNAPTQFADPSGKFLVTVIVSVTLIAGGAAAVTYVLVDSARGYSRSSTEVVDNWNNTNAYNNSVDNYNRHRNQLEGRLNWAHGVTGLANGGAPGTPLGLVEHGANTAMGTAISGALSGESGGQSGSAQSQDPNQKLGPAGGGSNNYINPKGAFAYRIDFENEKTATAPAQVVSVTDQFSSDLNWETFQLTGVGFGDHIITVPSNTMRFETTQDFTQDGKKLELQIKIDLDLTTGELSALFTTVDPTTDLPPGVDYGFLEPEDGSGCGQGYFTYTIEPKSGLATGTEIRNIADIIFDFNLTIATNQVDPHDASKGTDPTKEALVTIDTDTPTSSVTSLASESELNFTVSWSGSDTTSGVETYNVYVQDNGGAFSLWKTTGDTSATYTGTHGHTYGFFCVATDYASNTEAMKSTAETSTTAKDTASLTMAVTPADSGTTTPTAGTASTVEVGVATSIVATPATNYKFTSWTAEPAANATFSDANSTSATVTLTGDATITATFAMITYSLIMAVSPTDSGTTTPTVGASTVNAGANTSITATPAADYDFANWTAEPAANATFSDANTATSTVTLTGDATITATFIKKGSTAQLTIAVSPTASGTTTPTAGAASTVNAGEAISITATAASGYEFYQWSGDSTATFSDADSASTTVTLTGNATVTATFVVQGSLVKLTMAVSPTSSGTTTPTAASTTTLSKGTATAITATAATGYKFQKWTADSSSNATISDSNSSSTTVTLSADATVTAVFLADASAITLTMAVTPTEGGSTTPAVGAVTVESGKAQDITATPATNYYFLGWSISSESSGSIKDPSSANTSVTLTADATVTAEFSTMPAHSGTIGTKFSIKVDDVIDDNIGDAFYATPKVYGAGFDIPYKNKPGKAKLKTLTKIKNGLIKDSEDAATAVDCEFQGKIVLYDKKATKTALKEGKDMEEALTQTSLLQIPLKVKTKTEEGEKVNDAAAGIFVLYPPSVTSADYTGDLETNTEITLKGMYFGVKAPKVLVEYTVLKKDVTVFKYKNCKVSKASYIYSNAKGKENKSVMDVETGESQVIFLYPKLKPEKDTATGKIIVDNRIGINVFNISDD